MTPKLAREIYDIISDTSFVELYMDVIAKAVSYAQIRAAWTLSDEQAQTAMRKHRTSVHNAMIQALDKLATNMATADEPFAWFETLQNDRQESAEFACWVHYHLSLEA
jgi:hypothetical protein